MNLCEIALCFFGRLHALSVGLCLIRLFSGHLWKVPSTNKSPALTSPSPQVHVHKGDLSRQPVTKGDVEPVDQDLSRKKGNQRRSSRFKHPKHPKLCFGGQLVLRPGESPEAPRSFRRPGLEARQLASWRRKGKTRLSLRWSRMEFNQRLVEGKDENGRNQQRQDQKERVLLQIATFIA